MSILQIIVSIAAAIMIIGFVALVLLWAFTEELPRVKKHIPLYERLEAGEWAVQLERVGRRQMRTMRLVNEVLGGDIGAAKKMTEEPPVIIIEGVSQPLAEEIVARLQETGAEATLIRFPDQALKTEASDLRLT
jgi:ribosomal protein L7/L12